MILFFIFFLKPFYIFVVPLTCEKFAFLVFCFFRLRRKKSNTKNRSIHFLFMMRLTLTGAVSRYN